MIEPSPCVRVCVIDPTTGWCTGCGRTGQEIGDWLAMTGDQRRALKAALPGRLATLTDRRPKRGAAE
ncbi:MAG: DUF1289 domain-containing protein [Alphaproteobacteria bacterium]|nr:DUF1289 domain-containing protein [Alphaproteobacteria bacterium]TAD88544.1 MAG: DUF1289 domain-containing protein [Alphaproteobacteria bacterium]